MTTSDDSTAENAVLPWARVTTVTARPVLHLVVAWFVGEPERVGHVARVDRPCFFGRAVPGAEPDGLVTFQEIRPGECLAAPLVDNNVVSRRQLEFEPVEGGVRVKCVGLRKLFHNGAEVALCLARAGDTLLLENAVVFLLEERAPELPALRHYTAPRFPFGERDAHGIVGETPAAWRLREDSASIAATPHHTLLFGPSGAGKELAATLIHALSKDAKGPFIDCNASTLPPGLVDSELFGAAKNYPDSGSPEREGLVGEADGGTLLLDEIGELPEVQQAHLLRVLDERGLYQRLGDPRPRRSSFRLIGATNRDPSLLKHDFRARFGAVLEVPGLDARRGDIPFLIRELVRRLAATVPSVAERFLDGTEPKLDPALVEVLLRNRYTVHTRELNRLLALSCGGSPGEYLTVTPHVLAELDTEPTDDGGSPGARLTIDQLRHALRENDGNQSRAATWLGVHRDVVRRLMKKHDL